MQGPSRRVPRCIDAAKKLNFDSGVMAGPIAFGENERAAQKASIFIKFDGENMTTIPGVFSSRWKYTQGQ